MKRKKKRPAPTLTDQQAWKVMRLVFEGRHGMCGRIGRLRGLGLIDAATAQRMRNALDAERRRSGSESSYLWPTVDDEGNDLLTGWDNARIEFAEKQARRASRKRS